MVEIEDFIFSLEIGEMARNRSLSAIKSFFQFLSSRGILSNDPSEKIRSSRITKKNPVFLNEEEYFNLMDSVMNGAQGFIGLRDKAIIAFLLTTGARVSEITGIRFQDIVFDRTGNATIEVLRKGQEMDFLYLNGKVSEILKEYLQERKMIKSNSEYIFLTYRNGVLDRTAVYRLVKKYLEISGIEKNKKGPHILRHTFATALMRKNISLYKIKELLNHKNISTTEKYLHVEENDLRDVVEQIDF